MSAKRETREREKNNNVFLFPSSCASRSCRAPGEIWRSPRLAHKAPVMQANLAGYRLPCNEVYLRFHRNIRQGFSLRPQSTDFFFLGCA